jgi:hypothetical protein
MRKHASRWLLGTILGIIIVVFVFTFGFNKGGPDKTVAEVGAYKISVEEFYQTLTKIESYYRTLYGDKFDDEAKERLKLKEVTMASSWTSTSSWRRGQHGSEGVPCGIHRVPGVVAGLQPAG